MYLCFAKYFDCWLERSGPWHGCWYMYTSLLKCMRLFSVFQREGKGLIGNANSIIQVTICFDKKQPYSPTEADYSLDHALSHPPCHLYVCPCISSPIGSELFGLNLHPMGNNRHITHSWQFCLGKKRFHQQRVPAILLHPWKHDTTLVRGGRKQRWYVSMTAPGSLNGKGLCPQQQ